MNAAVFISGSGTNLEALLNRDLHVKIGLVISDNEAAYGLKRAEKYGVPHAYVPARGRPKAEYEEDVLALLKAHDIQMIILAGYMRFVGPTLLEAYPSRIINIHPAYLPEFPGAHGIADAWHAGVSETGVTVHYVDAGVDTGPVILQERVPVKPGCSLEELEADVHAKEYDLFWRAVNVAADRIREEEESK